MSPVLAAASSDYWPFAVLAISVAFIIFGISKLRLHAFLALVLAAMIAAATALLEQPDPARYERQVANLRAARARRTPIVRMVANWMPNSASLLAIPQTDITADHVTGDSVMASAMLSAAEPNIRPAQMNPNHQARSGTVWTAIGGR